MNKSQLLSRIRQIHALDTNAAEIYADLGENFPDEKGRALFQGLSIEEQSHAALEEEVIEMLLAELEGTKRG